MLITLDEAKTYLRVDSALEEPLVLGLLLGGCLLDAPGMFLAVPLMVIIRIVIEDIYHDAEKTEQPPSPME